MKLPEIKSLTPGQEEYPRRLFALGTPPSLHYCGNPMLLNPIRTIAIVGSRHADSAALALAEKAAEFFASKGFTVVSGLARGVDERAAYGALKAGNTVSVVPFGLNSSEGRRKRKFYCENPIVSDRILLVSELSPNAPWQARFAMMRNRIIVALSDAVLVVVTGPKERFRNGRKVRSGTWDAAEKARKLGRPVFTFELSTMGNKDLIRSGIATPVPPTEKGFFTIEEGIKNKKFLQKPLFE